MELFILNFYFNHKNIDLKTFRLVIKTNRSYETEIILKNNKKLKAFIYVPTKETINSLNLKPQIDLKDRWKEEIKRNPEVIMEFPELVL